MKQQVLGLREGDTKNSQVVRSLLRDLVDRSLDPERARLFVIDGAKALTAAIQKTFGSLVEIQRCQVHKRRHILGHLPDRRSALRAAAQHERDPEPELGKREAFEGGSTVARWVSAAIVETGKQFRRVQGWRDIEKWVRARVALEATEEATAERVAQDHHWSRRSEKINSERDDSARAASTACAVPASRNGPHDNGAESSRGSRDSRREKPATLRTAVLTHWTPVRTCGVESRFRADRLRWRAPCPSTSLRPTGSRSARYRRAAAKRLTAERAPPHSIDRVDDGPGRVDAPPKVPTRRTLWADLLQRASFAGQALVNQRSTGMLCAARAAADACACSPRSLRSTPRGGYPPA